MIDKKNIDIQKFKDIMCAHFTTPESLMFPKYSRETESDRKKYCDIMAANLERFKDGEDR